MSWNWRPSMAVNPMTYSSRPRGARCAPASGANCFPRRPGIAGASEPSWTAAVRDVAVMRQMGFPVFARGTCMYDSKNRQRIIDLDVVVEIAGVRFAPGDLVLADEDGVVVVPRVVETEVIRRAWEKVHAENVTRDAIRSGMKATEVFRKYGIL